MCILICTDYWNGLTSQLMLSTYMDEWLKSVETKHNKTISGYKQTKKFTSQWLIWNG